MYNRIATALLVSLLVTGSLTSAYAQTRPRTTTPAAPATPAAASTPRPDLLVRRDGTQLEVVVQEITDTEIVYKRPNNPNGPVFRVQKAAYSFVKYGSNDEIERFTEVAPQPAPVPVVAEPAPAAYQPRPAAPPATMPEGIRFGFKAGLQSVSWSISGSDFTGYSATSVLGFHGGLLLDMPLSTSTRLRAQAGYAGKGCHLSAVSGGDVSIAYIDIPVDILYKIPTTSGQFLLGGGGYFGYALSGKAGTQTLKIGSSASNDIIPTDFGLRFSAWYDLPSGLTLNAFYNLGLANINTEATNTIRNSALGIGLGYFLSKK